MKSMMKKVVLIEERTETYERVLKTKTITRKDGSQYIKETIERGTFTGPVALLDCGHKVGGYGGYNRNIIKPGTRRLLCSECEMAARQKARLEAGAGEA